VCISAITLAHDLGLTLLDCTQVGNSVKIRIETPLSRLVIRDGLSVNPSGIQLDQSIRNQLYLWRNGERIQPTQAAIRSDSQADMIRWEADIPGKIDDLSVSQRFYAKDSKSAMTITLHRPGKPNQVIQLDADHPTWNQSAPNAGSVVNMIEGFKLAVTHWQFVLLAIGLALVPPYKRTSLYVAATIPVAILLTVFVGFRTPAFCIPLALTVVAITNIWPQPSEEPTKARTGFRVTLALVIGFILGTSISPDTTTTIGLSLGCLAVFITASFLVAILSQKREQLSAKITYSTSIALGMIGTYGLVSFLLNRN
ncbi:MAG: hypothetical protein WCG75_10005, partial [Armatimonadota bacterium]